MELLIGPIALVASPLDADTVHVVGEGPLGFALDCEMDRAQWDQLVETDKLLGVLDAMGV